MRSRLTFLTSPTPCEFLPGRMRQVQYDIVSAVSPAEYMTLMRHGWRRFGHALFRYSCPGCQGCLSLRVPVATFRPDRSQARAWKANDGAVRIEIGPPASSKVKRALFDRFHRYQHHAKGWPLQTSGEAEAFVDNPFETEEWCYYVGDRLVAVGYVDNLPEGLSAIYFYYDPDERVRSLGTFNVLAVIDAARRRGLPHAYLGYYVAGGRSLEYKARFRPNEILGPDGDWRPYR